MTFDRWTRTVMTFPVLRSYATESKLSDGHVDEFDSAAAKGGEAARQAAAFVLNLWNSRVEWECGKFDLFLSMRRLWDHEQRNAFQQWAADPWFP